jgi:hypothetical protein
MGGDKIVVSGQKFITTYVPSNSQPFPSTNTKTSSIWFTSWAEPFSHPEMQVQILELWTWLTRFDSKEGFGFSEGVQILYELG